MSIDGLECSSNFYCTGENYWQRIPASIDGMLGGFVNVNTGDVEESRKLLEKINLAAFNKPLRALDCGSGIGRVTKYVLSHYFDEIDLLEQNKDFLENSKFYLGDTYLKIRNRICQPIQKYQPQEQIKYDCIWGQWVLAYITDQDLIIFLEKCVRILNKPHGVIVIKENITKISESIVDNDDGSVTRTEMAFKRVFEKVKNLELTLVLKQKKIPKDLFPVAMFVLKYKEKK